MAYAAGDFKDTEIRVHRAGAIGLHHVPTLAIYAHDEIPEFDPRTTTLDEARALYLKEGREIAEALIEHLAQGVVDQILVRLLDHKASLLRISEGVKGLAEKTS